MFSQSNLFVRNFRCGGISYHVSNHLPQFYFKIYKQFVRDFAMSRSVPKKQQNVTVTECHLTIDIRDRRFLGYGRV